MHQQPTDPATEVKRLRRCTNDLVSVLALPAVWSVSEPGRILETLLDALMEILDLNFLYARVRLDSGGTPIEALRTRQLSGATYGREEIRQALDHWFGENPQQWPEEGLRHLAGQDVSVFPIRMGIEGELGLIVAGSQRAGFPEQTESLVLVVAANQAAIGLQQALRLNEQKRVAGELDLRVAQRTAELAAANEILRTEIAERTEIEKRFKRSEARYRLVVEAASDAVISLDESGAIILANLATRRVFGYNPEDLIGKPLTVLMPEAMRTLHQAGFKRYLQTGARHLNWEGIELTGLRANGEEFPIEVSFGEMYGDHGKVFTGFIRDISEKKRSEEALLASERNLSLTINTMPVLAWSALPSGTVEFFNQRWLNYTGLSPEQAHGWGWTDAIHHDDLSHMSEYWQSIIVSGVPGEMEARLRRFDGSYRWFLFRADPMRDDSGAILKWYGTNTDIDDRRRAEEALRNTQEELARMMRVMTIGQLTASIAHEVSQPLSGIITNASTCLRMLNSEPPNVDGARDTVQRTLRDGKRATDVVTRLRTLLSKKQIRIERVDLNEAAREVIALLSDELRKNSVTVQQKFNDRLPPVKGDRVQLLQVILNLLRNASDSMVTVDDRPRQLIIRTDAEGSHATVFVQDSGVGFDPAMTDRLFDSFFTTKQEGMGIGLSLSRSIVEAHSGHLWAARNDGPGATFAFSIPCHSGPQIDSAP
jgi:PAS domain S-box-containing protein